jgi:hypothetical protein
MSSRAFLEHVRSFDAFGAPTQAFEQDGIPYLVNEFWTAGQRQAHSLHEVSYRACFKAQLPDFFIGRLTQAGDAVHDPFMGRGTTPLQAALAGLRPLGSDINPLSVLLVRPRLDPPPLPAIGRTLAALPEVAAHPMPEDLLTFFHPTTLAMLGALRDHLLRHAPLSDPAPDPVLDWIRMVAINRLTGHSPGFFSVYTMPPNQAVSVEAQRKINQARGQVPSPRDVKALILRKSRALLKDGAPPTHAKASLHVADSACTPGIGDASVDLVVTSPPFLDIVDYADDNWLRCWFAGIDVASVAIAHHRSEAAWEAMVRKTLGELARVVRPNGHVAFEVGEVRNGKVLLERLVWSAAEGLPFERLAVMVNQQDFTKTANCWGVSNNSKGTNTNRIVLLRRL